MIDPDQTLVDPILHDLALKINAQENEMAVLRQMFHKLDRQTEELGALSAKAESLIEKCEGLLKKGNQDEAITS